jgi:methyl-accepting chemotaxis protein
VTTTIAAAVSQQEGATVEIARSADVASRRAMESANGVEVLQNATTETRGHAVRVKAVADNLGGAATRIRTQVGDFVAKLRSA